MHRRDVLRGLGAAALGAGVMGASVSRSHAASSVSGSAAPVVTPLTDRLWLITGCGGNVTVFASGEGVLLVDGGNAASSKALLKQIARLTGTGRVHTLFNTHWHHDQTGLNLTLGKAGTRIIAHEYTRQWLTTDVISTWEQRTYAPLPRAALPTQTFYTSATLDFGGEQIEYGHLGQAHTDGDIYVFFRRANVLVAADVVSVGSFPIIDPVTNGWIGGLADAVGTLVKLSNDGTKVVPGLGAPQGVAQLKSEQDMLVAMRQRLSRLIAQGQSAEEMIAAKPAADFEAAWGDPALFIRNAYPGMAHRARELGVSIV